MKGNIATHYPRAEATSGKLGHSNLRSIHRSRIKVLNALPTMRPGHDGVTRVVHKTRQLFMNSGFSHTYASSMLPEVVPADMISVPSVPFPLSTNYRFPLTTASNLEKQLRSERFDIVHFHSFCFLSYSAAILGKRIGVPVVATYHTDFANYMPYYRLGVFQRPVWSYLRRLYAHCDAIIAPSQASVDALKSQGIEGAVYIPHGVETEQFSPEVRDEKWREDLGVGDKLIFSYVGRLVSEKSPEIVVEAWKRMKHKDRVHLVFAGGGPEMSRLKAMCPAATFLGQVAESEVPRIDASSDVFIFPSVTETFGNVTVEAMASGLPVIVGNVGGSRDLVSHGKSGFVLKRDPSLYAHYMDKLVENPTLRQKMSKNALGAAKEYRWENTVKRYGELYEDVLNAAPAARVVA